LNGARLAAAKLHQDRETLAAGGQVEGRGDPEIEQTPFAPEARFIRGELIASDPVVHHHDAIVWAPVEQFAAIGRPDGKDPAGVGDLPLRLPIRERADMDLKGSRLSVVVCEPTPMVRKSGVEVRCGGGLQENLRRSRPLLASNDLDRQDLDGATSAV